jgi:Fe2+ transport system protein FeoA
MILNSNLTFLRRWLPMSLAAVLTEAPQVRRTATPAAVSLAHLPAGTRARIVRVTAAPDDASRLMALGICVGRQIEIIKNGDPMIVSVVGARVGISARLAAGVTVQMAGVSAPSTLSAAS